MRTVSASTKELTAAPNSVSGHKHPDRDTSGRVCDWSDDVRNEHRSGSHSLAGLRALGRCVGNGGGTEQERSGCVVDAEWSTRLERIWRAD